MASSSRDIKRRIKSVKNIAQITKAMELVAATKMRKAQAQTLSSRPYAQLSSALVQNLAKRSDYLKHPLIARILPEDQPVPVQKILAVIITPDRGLAGALNTNLINKAYELLKSEGIERFDVITVGKKGANAARRLNLNIIAAFDSRDKNISIQDAKPIAEIAIEGFVGNFSAKGGSASGGKYEKVFVVYTDFVSTLTQKPNILQILPLVPEKETDNTEYLFEPGPDEVLDALVGKVVEFAIFQTMLEAVASEHSARMVAMRNANEAAADLIDDLSLTYNQARQASITKELSEISAAKLAMEG
ncbi:MAG: ATP synthase F1 subunit gamma [Candidatus Doudnabacteria bacterium]|nr:ATP synthase F1 subunit gamma [Candidatus Doudnabacteria bacterium]